jgi:aspartyl-tRNA(Asn)/glutamyl-tRNA(Gln) amidotransferase subunit C
MKIDEKEIVKVARLARLDLSGAEKAEFSKQLNDIIEYVEKISELDTSEVKPADHIADLNNVTREDLVKESLQSSDLEKIAPRFEKGHIVVPRIIE